MQRIARLCQQILNEPDPATKARLALDFVVPEQMNTIQHGSLELPDLPARPHDMDKVSPGQVPKRKWASQAGRLALLHAIAHIELNAIDLAFDMIGRFSCAAPIAPKWGLEFCQDWLLVGKEEAKHFSLITALMAKRGMKYGDLPVHGGMWDAATATRDRVDARLAIAPLVLEARGLDVTTPMIEKLKSVGDTEAAAVLEVIYGEEVGHVTVGVKWFNRVCQALNLEPETHFKHLVATRYTATLKPPFNIEARTKAGLPISFYVPDMTNLNESTE